MRYRITVYVKMDDGSVEKHEHITEDLSWAMQDLGDFWPWAAVAIAVEQDGVVK